MPPAPFPTTAPALAAVGRRFYQRGWVLGTSGNFSAVVAEQPLTIAITASAVHKGTLRTEHLLQVDGGGTVIGASRRSPSAETLLHLEIIRRRRAGAVLHTHSVWATMLSDRHAADGGLAIEGYEMLKGLRGVPTHEHREWIPIVDNDQHMPRLAEVVGGVLEREPDCHAILLRRHGLYTWGTTLADAERHVEVLEFLWETLGRSAHAAHGP